MRMNLCNLFAFVKVSRWIQYLIFLINEIATLVSILGTK